MNENALEMIELELAILLRRTTSDNNHKKVGSLDRSAYLLLRRIAMKGAVGVKVLSGEFQLDISTVSRQAAALEQKGYLYKIPDPLDGRAYTFEITELGKKVLKEHMQARFERITELLQDWPEEECRVFGELLRKFNYSFLER
ncbi:MarR family transcriptional regulator [Neobacillus drentensis]|uniref:MarR family winged helix-turn-helix transcriptional regulator n=1 Tax=Neobacillus drentensis TaxID=220684 RepID=UPI001F31BEE9|nr:MarR family transcriptional regulator [Neobacillus drentensis]ULT59054.1 MarR family transcriptional regulator [Neobacillus drentensis]